MCKDELPAPPKADGADFRHRIMKAIATSNLATGTLAEIAGVLQTPLERRRSEWFQLLWEAVKELQIRDRNFTTESLRDDEEFVTVVLHATHVALRTHQTEKLQALRNAVLNVAVGSAPDADLQAIFLDAVDAFTPSHVRILRCFCEATDRPSTLRSAISEGSLDIKPQSPLACQILRDLRTRGFVDFELALDQLGPTTAPLVDVKPTDFGRTFLSFVTSPLERP